MRNHFAHGAAFSVSMPNYSAQGIRDLAEVINRLWGSMSPGGRLYPAPLEREVLVIGWSDARADEPAGLSKMVMRAEQLLEGGEQGDDCQYLVIRGAWADERVMEFDARYELTLYPAELLWGSGSRAECIAWLTSAALANDHVCYLDRLFAIRRDGGKVFLPRRPEVLIGLGGADTAGTWSLVRADSPLEAFHHVRHVEHGEPFSGDERCPIDEVATGSWAHVVNRLRRELPDVEPDHPPNVRVPRRRPFPESVGDD